MLCKFNINAVNVIYTNLIYCILFIIDIFISDFYKLIQSNWLYIYNILNIFSIIVII